MQAQIRRSINAKMRGSERQRPDVLQMAKAFGQAADVQIRQGSHSSKADIIAKAMVNYNKHQKVANCKIEGDERAAVRFLAQASDQVWQVLRAIWNDFRVRESPVTANLLAAPYLLGPPSGLTAAANPKWFIFLTPNAAKHELWLRRLDGAFRARLDRMRREGKSPSLQSRAVPQAIITRHSVQTHDYSKTPSLHISQPFTLARELSVRPTTWRCSRSACFGAPSERR